MLENPQERIRFARPASIAGVELVIVSNSPRKWRAFHDTYKWCAAERAAASWRYRGKENSGGNRVSTFREPGETHHTYDVRMPQSFKILIIAPEVLAHSARELGLSGNPHMRFDKSDDPGLFSTLYRFSDAVESGAGALEQQSRFAVCVHSMLEYAEQRPHIRDGGREHHAVARIKHYLQERYAEEVTLDDLVALTGLSRFHLVRCFTHHTGMAPHVYHLNVRIERSRALLKAGVSPLQVAGDLGFSDQSHFTRHFKRLWGITPGAYANSVR